MLLPNLPVEERRLMLPSWYNTEACARMIFPDSFPRPFTSIHREMLKVLDTPSIQKVVICAPRGMGKTTTISKAFLGRHILYDLCKFCIYFSSSEENAVKNAVLPLRREMEGNPHILKNFGPQKSNMWLKEDWITTGGIRVLAKGYEQGVSGALWDSTRPDLIILDDTEDRNEITSETNRKKVDQWFHSTVLPLVDISSDKWRIVYIDTLKHEDSLLQKLLNSSQLNPECSDPDWYGIRIDLCDDNFCSNWPDWVSDEWVQSEYKSWAMRGQGDAFFREYRGIAIDTSDAAFPRSFQYYQEKDLDGPIENIVLCDPARTANPKSAHTAIVGVGVDLRKNAVYVRDIKSGFFHPEETYQHIFTMCERIGARTVGIETSGVDEFIEWPFMSEMKRRSKFLHFVPLRARGGTANEKGKDVRIGALIPLYNMGLVYHNSSGICRDLEAQLLSHPRSARKDIMDALAYIVQVMEHKGKFFFGQGQHRPTPISRYKNIPRKPPRENWRAI